MGDSMNFDHDDYRKIKHGVAGKLGSSLYCLINLQGFCMSFMIFDLRAKTFRPCPQTEAPLMCMERLMTRRYIFAMLIIHITSNLLLLC
jgi:hypothetical protein